MSGTNMTRILICTLFFSYASALMWYHESVMPWSRQAKLAHPAIYPDTLCLALSWSPICIGFDIHEGFFYAGSDKFELSIKSQYHELMSNHQLSIGMPIVNDTAIQAGIQLHYTLSALHGVESIHRGSCSGGLILHPRPEWQVSLSSMHILAFPGDSAAQILEPNFSVGFSFVPMKNLRIYSMFKKSVNLSWRAFVGVKWELPKALSLGCCYEMSSQHIVLNMSVGIGHLFADNTFGRHSYIGLTQVHMISYER